MEYVSSHLTVQQGWQQPAKILLAAGFNRLKPAGKKSSWQKVAKSKMN